MKSHQKVKFVSQKMKTSFFETDGKLQSFTRIVWLNSPMENFGQK